MAQPDPAALAALQTWNALPWWQKGLVGTGAGLNSLLRNDVYSPVIHAAAAGGLDSPNAGQVFDAQSRAMDAPFNSLPGLLPRMLRLTGEAGPLIALSGGAELGIIPRLAELGKVAPRVMSEAAIGSLVPHHRVMGAALGASLPAGAAAATGLIAPALRVAIRYGVPLPLLWYLARGLPAAAMGAKRSIARAEPVLVRRLSKAPTEFARKFSPEPVKETVQTAATGNQED